MNTLTKTDLEDLTLLLEDMRKQLPKLERKERIDVAARIRAAGKHIEAILDTVKDEVKKARNGKEGYVNGELFRAKMAIVPTHRLNHKGLRDKYPKIYDEFYLEVEDERVTYETR